MIVCSCERISDKDIHAAINWMRAADDATIITPGKIYHALGKTPSCGGCMKLFVASMRSNSNLEVPAGLRGLRGTKSKRSVSDEGRSQSYRVSEQSVAG
ncbi:BFD-like [2Fe-2S] binding domain-containing protein [Shimia haliotis]|uniref:BFD-like [2Fe-2S] binding domain-containing protein n=1 Tax=Shimia haliotis TaxID=1280847 RepID=A0A1I4FU43_9RHOB|nr:(2Fe-2S)-binding protein [Shimia haliotis]SFL20316.1 BFD-like [2Fe-2S] binding domain-containing protein [Shimia haliotis]